MGNSVCWPQPGILHGGGYIRAPAIINFIGPLPSHSGTILSMPPGSDAVDVIRRGARAVMVGFDGGAGVIADILGCVVYVKCGDFIPKIGCKDCTNLSLYRWRLRR